MQKIPIDSILYTDYSNHYIQIHLPDKTVRTYMRFEDFSGMLLIYSQFICCYRNCIINMDKVFSMEKSEFIFDNRRASAYYQDHAVADSPAVCRLPVLQVKRRHRMSFAQIQLISVILAEIIFIIVPFLAVFRREWRYSMSKTTGILMD